MVDLSLDSLGKSVGASIKGVAGTAAGATSNKLLGSAAGFVGRTGSGVVTGAIDAGLASVDSMLGGTANRKALEGAAGSVVGTVSDLFSGKTSVSALMDTAKGKIDGLIEGDNLYKTVGNVMGVSGDFIPGLKTLSSDLGSDWGSLSPLLMGRVFVCDSKGVADITEFTGVFGALGEGNIEVAQNWQSPFENTGPDTKAPALAGMLQSGSLVPVLNALQAVSPFKEGAIADMLNTGSDKLKAAVKELEGRTGITKLNSRQVFSGMPPVKLNFTLHFRAMSSALTEVEAPLARLLEWVFPQELAEDGILSEVLQTTKDVDSFIKALFPSKAPKLLGLTYAGRTYAPMVIESINFPLDAPKDSNGNYIALAVQVSMATLTALDRADIKRFFTRQ